MGRARVPHAGPQVRKSHAGGPGPRPRGPVGAEPDPGRAPAPPGPSNRAYALARKKRGLQRIRPGRKRAATWWTIDQEMNKLAKNHLMYNATVQMLAKELEVLKIRHYRRRSRLMNFLTAMDISAFRPDRPTRPDEPDRHEPVPHAHHPHPRGAGPIGPSWPCFRPSPSTGGLRLGFQNSLDRELQDVEDHPGGRGPAGLQDDLRPLPPRTRTSSGTCSCPASTSSRKWWTWFQPSGRTRAGVTAIGGQSEYGPQSPRNIKIIRRVP